MWSNNGVSLDAMPPFAVRLELEVKKVSLVTVYLSLYMKL